MGNRISARNGLRSPNIYQPGNAVNEIWIDDFELISRLPFGDSDMAQAGWPKGDYPKIPWRPFIIPLRAAVSRAAKSLQDTPSLLSRRSLVTPLQSEVPDMASSISPWALLLVLSVLFFLGPIVIYHVPRLYSKKYQRPSSFRLATPGLECEAGEHSSKTIRHLTTSVVVCAQSLGDAGLCLMYFAVRGINGGLCLPLGEGKERAAAVQACVVMLATISRAYLLGIWWEYLKGYRRSDVEDGGLRIDDLDWSSDSEKSRLWAQGS